MSDSLRNKVVIVTGASSGIGRSVALESAGRGANLILVARRKDKLDEVAAECRELSGVQVHVFITDMGKPKNIEHSFTGISKTVKKVDFLVNCAGFGKFEDFLTSRMQDASNMFMVNVLGLMYFTRLIGRMMLQERSGQIINMGSIAGKIPTAKSAAYSATKAAVIQFSNVLRLELKPFGVQVMTVNPGPVYTNFFNIADKSGHYVERVAGFMQDPDDVAWQIVHFMGSDRREINSPLSLAILAKLYNLFPRLGDYLSLRFASRK